GQTLRETLRTGKTYAEGWSKYEADLAEYQVKKKEFDAAAAKAPPPPKKDEKKDDKPEAKKPEEKTPEAKKPEPPKEPSKPQLIDAMEPYRALFSGKMPALVEAKREDAIRLAVTVFRDEFNLKMMLVDGDDAHRVADLLAAKSVGLIAGPALV